MKTNNKIFTTKPEILTHPNIPKPLHGLSPRTIMGENWWNRERQKVYESTDYHCIACGIHKTKAKKYNWLEAHEYFDIDYNTGRCEVISIEPLCHYCHNFIHSGRLAMIINKEKSRKEVIEILEHGFKILFKNKLDCFNGTYVLANRIKCNLYNTLPYRMDINMDMKWNDWRLVFNGKEYKSKFKSYNEWKSYYNKISK